MFKLEINIIFWTLISFGLVCWIINAKIYPVLAKMMRERAERITGELADAEKQRRAAETLRAELAEQQKNIELAEHRILSEAREKARAQAAGQFEALQAEFRALRKTKEADLRRLEDDFYRNFEERVGKMLYTACEKVLRVSLTPEMQQRILQERLEELKKLKEF
ncbi:MAG: ATP synthase F0 subunit B [Candidatus Margulisbacteria bacterium]|nr:ATP synthase F0 subunit B [Candidatus Margulisiibacteriota bacterium]